MVLLSPTHSPPANTKSHPPLNVFSSAREKGEGPRGLRGDREDSPRSPGLQPFKPKLLKVLPPSLHSGVGDWDPSFGDQGPCSGVRVLLGGGANGQSSARGENGDLKAGGWGRRRWVQPWAGPRSEVRRGLTVAVLKQGRRVVEAAEGRAALRHRPATATAGPPGPSSGPVPSPGLASRCHSNALRSSIPGSARPASGGRRRAWHWDHPPGCLERGVGTPPARLPNTILGPRLVTPRSPSVPSGPAHNRCVRSLDPYLACSGPMRACRAGRSANRDTEGLEGAGPSQLFSLKHNPRLREEDGVEEDTPISSKPSP